MQHPAVDERGTSTSVIHCPSSAPQWDAPHQHASQQLSPLQYAIETWRLSRFEGWIQALDHHHLAKTSLKTHMSTICSAQQYLFRAHWPNFVESKLIQVSMIPVQPQRSGELKTQVFGDECNVCLWISIFPRFSQNHTTHNILSHLSSTNTTTHPPKEI
jgi:hypothetical protein